MSGTTRGIIAHTAAWLVIAAAAWLFHNHLKARSCRAGVKRPRTAPQAPVRPAPARQERVSVSGPSYPMPSVRERRRYRRLWDRFYMAIRRVESSDGKHLTGDAGRSNGPYHISRDYWTDACKAGGLDWDYDTRVNDRDRCEYVMLSFWSCHDREAVDRLEFEILAALHQRGPEGWRNMTPKRRAYCLNVLREMVLGDAAESEQ